MSSSLHVHPSGLRIENSYTQLPPSFYSMQVPAPVSAPKLRVFNESLAISLGLDVQWWQSHEGVSLLAGQRLPDEVQSFAQAYAGHQFGHFTMLGDGRAILLGEHLTPRKERIDLQWKGSGRTLYSRGGDGRAALGPMLREYIISEAMHALGIPSTRSLAVVTTGEPVYRETELPGAILTRIASSHIRVGTFQYAAARGKDDELRLFADYTIKRHFSHISLDDDQRYAQLLYEVIVRQASLIAKWQHVGFIHGVMNTDNMAISGETIDYGPCAFMDRYDPQTVFSSIDVNGRYAYQNQPQIALWNLARFAETLLPLLHPDEPQAIHLAEAELGKFSSLFQKEWLSGMKAKLGIFNAEESDESLVQDLLSLMERYQLDYTHTFRTLTTNQGGEGLSPSQAEVKAWIELWQSRLQRQPQTWEQSQVMMRGANPAIIPRNHRVEEALSAAVEHNNDQVMVELVAALREPYAYKKDLDQYAELPPHTTARYRTFCGT